MKPLSAEALLSANTRPVMGPVSFLEQTPVGGKGKNGKMFEVICDVGEAPVLPTGKLPGKPRIICDEFGHLTTNRQRGGVTGGEISDLRMTAWLGR